MLKCRIFLYGKVRIERFGAYFLLNLLKFNLFLTQCVASRMGFNTKSRVSFNRYHQICDCQELVSSGGTHGFI